MDSKILRKGYVLYYRNRIRQWHDRRGRTPDALAFKVVDEVSSGSNDRLHEFKLVCMPLVLLLGSTNNALESRFVLDCIFNWMLLSSLSSQKLGLSSNALGEKEILNLSGGAATRLVILISRTLVM